MKIDPRITLALILALFLETAGGLIWAGRAAARLEEVERAVATQPEVAERLARMEEADHRCAAFAGADRATARRRMIVEGYAALFGVADQMHDVVRAGAFGASLRRRVDQLPMLVEHEARLLAGHWADVREDGRGLWLRGEIRDDMPGAARAKRMLARGVDGLSIGFVPVVAHASGKGRVLTEIELLEVSIVTHPMQPLARLSARAMFDCVRPDAKPDATFAGRTQARLTLAREFTRAA